MPLGPCSFRAQGGIGVAFAQDRCLL